MIIAINQSYFLPYIGYFSLIKHTDQFILLNAVQFVPQSWMRRNRILKQGIGWEYISVPTKKAHRSALISDILLCNDLNWKQEILNKLTPYKRIAPNYFKVVNLLKYIFKNEFTDLATLNSTSIKIICDYLEIEYNIKDFSEMNLKIDKPNSPDEWALNICKALGNVDEYWNPPGGKDFYDLTKYDNAGLKIKFLSNNLKPYNQKRELFEPRLSIIDVMMFNKLKEIHEMLDDFKLL
jgi:hypothetical protein